MVTEKLQAFERHVIASLCGQGSHVHVARTHFGCIPQQVERIQADPVDAVGHLAENEQQIVVQALAQHGFASSHLLPGRRVMQPDTQIEQPLPQQQHLIASAPAFISDCTASPLSLVRPTPNHQV